MFGWGDKNESVLKTKSIMLGRNQTCQNHFYRSRINFGPSISRTKHTKFPTKSLQNCF